MVNIIELLKKDLKKIKKGEEPSTSHIVFKQKIVCNGKKHTDYYLWQPRKEEHEILYCRWCCKRYAFRL